MNPDKLKTVESYIAGFPPTTQKLLVQMRAAIRETAPRAEESISYGMPAYKLNKKPLVYFAGYKNHIGFYATPDTHLAFQHTLSAYKQAKGSVQFPLTTALPLDTIKKMVEHRQAVISKGN